MVKYPTPKTKNESYVDYANRGLDLEEDINITNQYYLDNNIALIHKKPTPIQVVDVKYEKRKKPIITNAFFKTPSTTDYNGLYKGKYLDFEAKSTNNKKSFPLSNIHAHQLKHMKQVLEHKGITFIIVRFKALNKTFLYEGEKLFKFIEKTNKNQYRFQSLKKMAI